MTVREALREGAAALAGTETPFLDASLLLAAALGSDTTRLLASGPEPVGEGPYEKFLGFLASRSGGLPVAYILGYKEFWGRRFAVDPRVLIPRPDTETLVEEALRTGDAILAARRGPERPSRDPAAASAREPALRVQREPALRVHEACAGSGCVAISLAADRPEWAVSASDLSAEALEVAASNAEAILGPGRGARARPGGALALSRGDLLSPAPGPLGGAALDLIAANPPYVPSAEASELLGRGWSEPPMALDGGPDGLGLARRLVLEAVPALAPGGALLIESDPSQAGEIAGLMLGSGFVDVRTSRDLGGRDRVTSGRRPWTT